MHVREPHGGKPQSLHADAITDVRPDAFDVQLTYYPQHVTPEMGGTLSVPGSHPRRINETRYMFKIRFNPTVRQRLLGDTSDLDDPRVAGERRAWFPW